MAKSAPTCSQTPFKPGRDLTRIKPEAAVVSSLADTEAGQVGAVIAEILQVPLVTGVIKINLPPGSSRLMLHRKVEGGNREVVESPLPTVITVGTGLNKPRYPSLRSMRDAERKPIEKYGLEALGLSAEDVGASGSKTKVLSISPAKPMLKQLFIPDSHLPAAERICLLMSGGLVEKRGDVVGGDPKEATLKFVQFLTKRKLI